MSDTKAEVLAGSGAASVDLKVSEKDASISSPTALDTSEIVESKLLFKIDLHILPILCIVYLLAFLDRVNIGNANVYGLSEELKLTGTDFNVALCIFFVPYIIFEIPSNLLLKYIKPHIFLSVCMFLFGLVSVLQGLVTTKGQLICTRFFLGFFETGVFPGCFYILAMWYKRTESQKRFTFFFLSTAMAGAFGGLIASAIYNMDGKHGKLAWRWVFIIEGAVTCGIAILSWFLIPDFPEDVKWLSPNEVEFVKKRLRDDVGDNEKEKPFQFSDLACIVKDWKFIQGALMYFSFLIVLYSFSYFSPTIIRNWKFSPINTQLRTVPVWVVAWVVSMTVAYFSDRLKHRFWFVFGPTIVSIIGIIILMTVHNNIKVQYFALYLSLGGVFCATPISVCWFTTNLRGHTNRSIGSAFQIAFGNFGGIIATFIFLAKDAPRYYLGYGICAGACVLAMLCSAWYYLQINHENKKLDRGEEVYGVHGEAVAEYRFIR